MLRRFTRVRLFATLWTVACQAPLSVGFSRQDYWSGLSCPLPGDVPDPGIKPASLLSPALAGELFTTHATWEAPSIILSPLNSHVGDQVKMKNLYQDGLFLGHSTEQLRETSLAVQWIRLMLPTEEYQL